MFLCSPVTFTVVFKLPQSSISTVLISPIYGMLFFDFNVTVFYCEVLLRLLMLHHRKEFSIKTEPCFGNTALNFAVINSYLVFCFICLYSVKTVIFIRFVYFNSFTVCLIVYEVPFLLNRRV